VLLVAGSAFAFNILVTIAGVTPTGKGAEPIAITSFSFGVSNPVTAGSTGGGAGAGRPSFEDLQITKVADATTPKLFLAVSQGTHIPTLVLTLQKGASSSGSGAGAVTTFETITLKNVVVTSFEQEGASTDDAPTEQVTFAYGQIEFTFTPAGGAPVSASWNLMTQTGS
jgi:type VI secretion system secreted protein Hcp